MVNYQIPKTFSDLEEIILPTVKQYNEISYKAKKTLPWESKLGGCPYLESIDDYPVNDDGKPYIFLAQINFEEMYPLENYPTEGILQFYIRGDDNFGLDEENGFVIKYIDKITKDIDKLFVKNPYKFKQYDINSTEDDDMFFIPYEREGKMKFKLKEMAITLVDRNFENIFKDVVFNEYQEDELYESFPWDGSRIGGYPGFTQSDPRKDNEYDMLLLQLDMDEECGIMFGDAGIANFFIKKEDLINRDFTKVYYTWDCC